MMLQAKHIESALKRWNNAQEPWTKVFTYGQLTDEQRDEVLSMSVAIAAHFAGVRGPRCGVELTLSAGECFNGE
jgi:hypothetical protein